MEQVTANELRRNNLIMYGNLIYPVDRITEQSISVRLSSQRLRTARPHEFEPVPLLPEILQACGFVSNGDKWIWHFSWHTFRVDDDMVLEYGGISYSNTPLHRLQNLVYILTGSELTVNLEHTT